MSRKLDWEKANRVDMVRERGTERTETQASVQPAWMSGAQRSELVDRGYPVNGKSAVTRRDAAKLLRVARRIGVTLTSVRRVAKTQDERERRKLLFALRVKVQEQRWDFEEQLTALNRGAQSSLRSGLTSLRRAPDRLLDD